MYLNGLYCPLRTPWKVVLLSLEQKAVVRLHLPRQNAPCVGAFFITFTKRGGLSVGGNFFTRPYVLL